MRTLATRMANELDISAEHALAFIRAIALWRSRAGQRVRFEYVSLQGNRTMQDGQVTSVSIFGAEAQADNEWDAWLGLAQPREEQSVVVKIDGRGSYRVWPEDRVGDMQVFPAVHPCAALIKDIEFSRCGRDGEMRLRSKNLLRGVAWDFDMEAFSLLYVFPTDPLVVARLCPRAFPSLKRVAPAASERAATMPLLEPEAEDDCV